METGLDSLGAIEMQQSIMEHFQVHIPSTFIFDNPTIGSMTSYLVAHVFPSEANTRLNRIEPQPQSNDINKRNLMTRLVGISCRFPRGRDHMCMYYGLRLWIATLVVVTYAITVLCTIDLPYLIGIQDQMNLIANIHQIL